MKNFIYFIVLCGYSLVLHAQQITYQLDTNPNQLTTTQANDYDVIELEEATYLEGEEYVGNP